ncbi:sideroflexin-4 [Megalops cyprinoides]|uniref:sideroflexin-4 n=1 Tax=Megalops cyprinoides TaxID=118141 RepID=UPI001864EC9D|nr:sideroflexin-4 [Megalops cyprinoides]
MDVNLQFWRSEGQSFLGRLYHWVNILDPSGLLSSDDEIEKARSQLGNTADLHSKNKVMDAWKLSLSSVHPDTGSTLPVIFRPPAFLPIASPLVIGSFLPHNGVKPALFWQFLLHSFSAGFNYANRNATSRKDNKVSLKQLVLIVGSVTYATCVGTLPQFLMTRYGLTSPSVQRFFRSVLPVPLSACLSAFNVLVVRAEEYENGIQVFDSNGKVVGVSQNAGMKAVNETAVSRAVMIGTTAAVPNLLVGFLQRTRFGQRSPLVVAPFRHIITALVLGLMIPVSFSLFPQLGTIQKEKLEKELQAATSDGQLFYHRGL